MQNGFTPAMFWAGTSAIAAAGLSLVEGVLRLVHGGALPGLPFGQAAVFVGPGSCGVVSMVDATGRTRGEAHGGEGPGAEIRLALLSL